MAKNKTEEVEKNGEGGAFKRVDQTQGAYDDSALSDTLAELAESERQRVEDEKPSR